MRIQEIFPYIAIALGGFICIMNWLTVFYSRKEEHFISAAPFIGAIFLGYGLLSFPQTRPYAWISIIADYGTLIVIISIPYQFVEYWPVSRFNMLHSFLSLDPKKKIKIKLFKKGIFTISAKLDPPAPCDATGVLVSDFSFEGSWEQTLNTFMLKIYVDNRILKLSPKDNRYLIEEQDYPADTEFPYDSLDEIALKKITGIIPDLPA